MNKFVQIQWLFIFYFVPATISAQGSEGDRLVQIQNANRFFFRSNNAGQQLQMMAGNVRMIQGKTVFQADSIVYNEQTLFLEGFGNVHIIDKDSIHIYSNYLLYDGKERMAHFKDKVKLSDGNGVLYTGLLDYDMKGKYGSYREGGRIETDGTILTSKSGYYYGNVKNVYFYGNVKMVNSEMTLETDSLLYNTGSRVSTFIAPTTITSGKSVVQTKKGSYDSKEKKARFEGRAKIKDSSSVLEANDIHFDDASGLGEAKGKVWFKDTVQNILLSGNRIYFNKIKNSFLATEKPVMVIVQEEDSIFVAADTIYSGLMADLPSGKGKYIRQFVAPLTITQKKGATVSSTDTLRFITAFKNVRIYNDSLQAVGDSLYYSTVDSVFELYYNPVAWSKENQISGDTMFIKTRDKKPARIQVINNGFMIQQENLKASFYNQIKGRIIDGYFKEGKIDNVIASGSAESIYFIKNEDSAYVGMNKSAADRIQIFFDGRSAYKIKFDRTIQGINYPIRKIPAEDKKLRAFEWKEARRPKNKNELFQ